jgi:hypothetical protein
MINDELRQEIIERLRRGEELDPQWAGELFPTVKREYELVYPDRRREVLRIANPLLDH